MGMTRANALTYLTGQYATGPEPLQAATGTTPDDTDTGYGPAIDDALLALGTDYDSLPVTEVNGITITAYRALLRYNALALFARRVTPDTNVQPGAGSVSIGPSVLLKQIRDDMDREAVGLKALGYGPTAQPAVFTEVSADIYA
jgi:hypothetical protein